MELQRSINSRSYLFCLGTVFACFIFGYILPISIDHVDNLDLNTYFNSVYTVFTQFGPLIFSIVIIYIYNIDYKEKNILFYKVFGYSSIKYFINKFIIIAICFTLSILLMNLITCIAFNDFKDFFIMFMYYENALIYILAIASIFSYLFKNILFAFCINLAVWIGGVVLATSTKTLAFLAYYDASNRLYDYLTKYLETGNLSYLMIFPSISYNLTVLLILIIIVTIFRKRWVKNGVY